MPLQLYTRVLPREIPLRKSSYDPKARKTSKSKENY